MFDVRGRVAALPSEAKFFPWPAGGRSRRRL